MSAKPLKDKLGHQLPKLWKELYDEFLRQGDTKSVAKRKAYQITDRKEGK